MHHPADRLTHTTAFVTPMVDHWLEREIALNNKRQTAENSEQEYSFMRLRSRYCNRLIMKAEPAIDKSGIVTVANQHFLFQTCRANY